MNVTLGGERLGSGKKEKVYLREYERSSHNQSMILRTTMSPGTLVPALTKVCLPGETVDIDIEVDVKTLPTIGPLYGSYKLQIDVFEIPVRLYQGLLHMNALGVGLQMEKVKLPRVLLKGFDLDGRRPMDGQQVNPSSIMNYLGIAGLGHLKEGEPRENGVQRWFNALPWLMYWDITKNYYSNKQEEVGYVIHNNLVAVLAELTVNVQAANGNYVIEEGQNAGQVVYLNQASRVNITLDPYEEFDISRLRFYTGPDGETLAATEIFRDWIFDNETSSLSGTNRLPDNGGVVIRNLYGYSLERSNDGYGDIEPRLVEFPLKNIDKMREKILRYTNDLGDAFSIMEDLAHPDAPGAMMPYAGVLNVTRNEEEITGFSLTSNQEGLAVKTYQSDLFNNWLDTETIDGPGGINEITAVEVVDNKITMDALLLSRKIYDMLNRIQVTGGTYDDWLDATYTHDRVRSIDNPMYMGGLIKEIVFQEVISNSESADQPLGTLAGRGVLGRKHKGGHVKVRTNEPSYIMAIASITPRIDYSQGNQWDTCLMTMNDFHKPGLDEIGFQDLITDQMAYWETEVSSEFWEIETRSAGKQPAWQNYRTAYNQVKGNFAIETEQMFMVLNRRYEVEWEAGAPRIKDLTTYIDPKKYNHIFANGRRDAQNFMVQIGFDIVSRKKMSARVMPNL